MISDNFAARACQGAFGFLICWGLIIANIMIAMPMWVAIFTPIPGILILIDSLGPKPHLFRHISRRSKLPAVLAAIFVAMGALILLHPALGLPPVTDQPATITCAAQAMWHGQDPYKEYEPQCFRQLRVPPSIATPVQTGAFTHDSHLPSKAAIRQTMISDQLKGTTGGFPAYGYPPLAAIAIFPVAEGGWLAIDVWIISICLLLMAAMWWMPISMRILLVVWQSVVILSLVNYIGWNPEYVAYLLLAAALALLPYQRSSSILMAAAVLCNPWTWPAIPAYVGTIWRLPNWRSRTLWFLGFGLLMFGGYMVWDHNLPIELWRFVTMSSFPLGADIGQLLPYNHTMRLILLGVYTATLLSSGAIAYFCPRWRLAAFVMAYAAFFLTWRGLVYYYIAAFIVGPALLAGAWRIQHDLKHDVVSNDNLV